MANAYVPSTSRRLVAAGIDGVVRLVFYTPFLKPFFLLIFTDDEVYLSLFSLAILFLIPAVYEFIFLVIMQATPGKWMMGLKVVPFLNSDEALDWRQCVLRPLVKRLSFFFSLAIYAVAFFRYDRTHLADWIAETRVVQNKPRVTLPRIRWFVGSILVLIYIYEGLLSASTILQVVDWRNKQVELRSLLGTEYLNDMPEIKPSTF